MPDTHPSGRPATPIDAAMCELLIVAPGRPLHRFRSQDCWLLAKERQRLRGGKSAAIHGDRLTILEDLPSHWPGPPLRLVEAPMVVGHEMSEVEAATQAARPAIMRAVARKLGMGSTGGDAA